MFVDIFLKNRSKNFYQITQNVKQNTRTPVIEKDHQVNVVKFGYTCVEVYAQWQLTQTSLRRLRSELSNPKF